MFNKATILFFQFNLSFTVPAFAFLGLIFIKFLMGVMVVFYSDFYLRILESSQTFFGTKYQPLSSFQFHTQKKLMKCI